MATNEEHLLWKKKSDDGTKVNTVVLSSENLPSLDASKITSGTLNASRIPSLDASKITSGTFADTRIASASTWNSHMTSNANVSVLGHVYLVSGDLNGKTFAAGYAAASAHTHSQYITTAATNTEIDTDVFS